MKRSRYQLLLEKGLENRAIELYKAGLTMRKVGSLLGRSRTWVWRVVNERLPDAFVDNSVDNLVDKEKQRV